MTAPERALSSCLTLLRLWSRAILLGFCQVAARAGRACIGVHRFGMVPLPVTRCVMFPLLVAGHVLLWALGGHARCFVF